MFVFPERSLVAEFDELRFGQGIGQSKRDEVGCSVLSPVGQVPRVDSDALIRVQPSKLRRYRPQFQDDLKEVGWPPPAVRLSKR